jgi:hypothetical protein
MGVWSTVKRSQTSPADCLAEQVGQRSAASNVEVVPDQVDPSGCGVMESKVESYCSEHERGAIWRGGGDVAAAFGSTAQKMLAVPRRSYSLSILVSGSGLAADTVERRRAT